MHDDTKIYLRLNRNENEHWQIVPRFTWCRNINAVNTSSKQRLSLSTCDEQLVNQTRFAIDGQGCRWTRFPSQHQNVPLQNASFCQCLICNDQTGFVRFVLFCWIAGVGCTQRNSSIKISNVNTKRKTVRCLLIQV